MPFEPKAFAEAKSYVEHLQASDTPAKLKNLRDDPAKVLSSPMASASFSVWARDVFSVMGALSEAWGISRLSAAREMVQARKTVQSQRSFRKVHFKRVMGFLLIQ